ncbi:MAG TPA: 3-octaprenyl-4-hydroxybenzoate carboxy-lyase [Desulfobacteraceae bacterium]|nr:3-octaprenyl-4-hydroxybenzoate carboxy-lyase [Desulfobacteraceae bacterium]
MKFSSLKETAAFLQKIGELAVIDHEVDPHLEMAEITRQVHRAKGPALLFTRVKHAGFPALSNLFGTWERTRKIFEPQLAQVKALVDLRSDPSLALRSPARGLNAAKALIHALPVRTHGALSQKTTIDRLPLIQCWPKDGGAFVLLPQVFSRDPERPAMLTSNLGMYRVQLTGNAYAPNREIGLHYQIHRGISAHHKKAMAMDRPLKVSIFIGGPPAHTLAAVMPLPENVPEIAFAGALAGRNFRYREENGFILSGDADFCITGLLMPHATKPEGPFGDHLGYYSLTHDFPYLKVEAVYHRPGAIFPFTVVGRPPQEDSNFGRLIHEITRTAITDTLPGVTGVNAVDDAGVHPLLLAKAHERYVPYESRQPREILTHASAILGTGQLSLAKYLCICAHEDDPGLDLNCEQDFFKHLLERIDFSRDIHFITRTTMDTLDYSGRGLNLGSKVVFAAAGPRIRTLESFLPEGFSLPEGFKAPVMAAPGMAVVKGPGFQEYESEGRVMGRLTSHLEKVEGLEGIPLIVVADDPAFAAKSFANFLWVTFLRSNPSHDIYGVNERIVHKHWGCSGSLIIDARIKPFHASPLEPDPEIERRVREMGRAGGPLAGLI